MIPPQLSSEADYLRYVLRVADDGAAPPIKLLDADDCYWLLTWLERQERAALYALGRIRESIAGRAKRLPPERAEEQAFLVCVLAQCQGDDGGSAAAPCYPAQALRRVAQMVSDRLLVRAA